MFLNPADHPELDALLASCAEEPWNIDLRLILADWLEENGDPRAELYRLAAYGENIVPWLRRWEEWLGPDAHEWLLSRDGRLRVRWRHQITNQNFALFQEGWVNAVAPGYYQYAWQGDQLTFIDKHAVDRLTEIRLVCNGRIHENDRRVLRSLPRLRSLVIQPSSNLRHIEELPQFAQIADLCLTGNTRLRTDTLRPLKQFIQLRRLSVAGCNGMRKGAFEHIAPLRSLEHLSLATLDWVRDEHVAVLAGFPKLTHLDLGCDWFLSDDVFTILAKFPNLKSLRLVGVTGLTDLGEMEAIRQNNPEVSDAFVVASIGSVAQVAGKARSLRDRVNELERGITRDGMAMCGTLQGLERLSVAACQQLDDAALTAIARLPRLRELDIRMCEGISNRGIEALGQVTRLERLWMGPNSAITDEAVASLARLRQLRYLQMSCPSLSSAAVLRLREELPACRIVEPHRNK